MIVLALDGALHTFSAAAARDGELLAAVEIDGREALERGLERIGALMSACGIAPKAIARIAVGVGPGSFTGIRIAVSYAKSLAFGWRVPLVPISSFDILEGEPRNERALAVVSGRPGIVCARFRDGKMERRAGGAPRDVLERLLPHTLSSVPLFGDAEDVRDVLAERGVHVEPRASTYPPAAAVALLACSREPAPSSHAVRPEYGERPAARLPQSRSLR